MSPREAGPASRRTFWHLDGTRRLPDDYAIGTSRLLTLPAKGFSTPGPAAAWYDRWCLGSPLSCDGWEAFADPRRTTYASWVRRQSSSQLTLDHLLASAAAPPYRRRLPRAWRETGEAFLAPLRFPVHAMQMCAAYLGQLAPAGRLVVAAAFQAADEIRRADWAARRAAALREEVAVSRAREQWERGASWQPLREQAELLLVTWDWDEAFAALNLCLKPLLDDLMATTLADAAREGGDPLTAEMLACLDRDAAWQKEWSAALVRMLVSASPANRAHLEGWVARRRPPALRALEPLLAMLGGETAALAERHGRFLASAGWPPTGCASTTWRPLLSAGPTAPSAEAS